MRSGLCWLFHDPASWPRVCLLSLFSLATLCSCPQVSDIFPVVHGDSDKVLAVGLLMTGRGWCQITVGGKVHNFTSDHPYDTDFSTPYIVYVLKSDGQALNYTKFAEVEADLVRSALRNGDTVTFLGMVMNSYDATVQHITCVPWPLPVCALKCPGVPSPALPPPHQSRM